MIDKLLRNLPDFVKRYLIARWLRKLADKKIDPPNKRNMLCLNLDDKFHWANINTDSLCVIFRDWPHFSGSIVLPVRMSLSVYEIEKRKLSLLGELYWGNHKYGDMRRNLCRFIADNINRLEFYKR